MSEPATKVKLNNQSRVKLHSTEPWKSANLIGPIFNLRQWSFYNGTIFHRVIPGLWRQGGGFDTSLIKKQFTRLSKMKANNACQQRGTWQMARTNVPDSATAQFFINYKENSFLNYTSPTASGWAMRYLWMIQGMDVVDAMADSLQATAAVIRTCLKQTSWSRKLKSSNKNPKRFFSGVQTRADTRARLNLQPVLP